jgi:hypothetical protein
MNVISHIVYPVLFAQTANGLRIHKREAPLFSKKQLLLIGIGGALPDILSPHLGLQERYESFWHSLWFVLLIAVSVLILSRMIPRHRRLIYFCAFATAFHLICDMIAGGINLYGPFGRLVMGRYFVPFQYWIPLDMAGILLLLVAFAYSACPLRARPFILASGSVLAICGTGIAFTAFDIETVLAKRIPASEINRSQADEAMRAWDALLTRWQKGAFEPAPNDFTAKMREALTPQNQKKFYEQMRRTYGDYRELVLVEAVMPRFYFPRMTVYRFKGTFSNTSHRPEIDIVFDRTGKVSGLMFREKWKNKIL